MNYAWMPSQSLQNYWHESGWIKPELPAWHASSIDSDWWRRYRVLLTQRQGEGARRGGHWEGGTGRGALGGGIGEGARGGGQGEGGKERGALEGGTGEGRTGGGGHWGGGKGGGEGLSPGVNLPVTVSFNTMKIMSKTREVNLPVMFSSIMPT